MQWVLTREFSTAFPLIGIPIENVFGTYLSLPIKLQKLCKIRANIKLSNIESGRLNLICDPSIKDHLRLFLEELINEVYGRYGIHGSICIECDASIPKISIYFGATSEIAKGILKVMKTELQEMIDFLSTIDEHILAIDRGFAKSMRGAGIFKSVYIGRIDDQIQISGDLEVSLRLVQHIQDIARYRITKDVIDRYVLSLILKLQSHAIAEIVSWIREGDSKRLKQLRSTLWITTWLENALLTLDRNFRDEVELRLGRDDKFMKIVLDLDGIKLYEVELGLG